MVLPPAWHLPDPASSFMGAIHPNTVCAHRAALAEGCLEDTVGRNCLEDAALIEVGTGYKDSAQLGHTVLQYDLWLKHLATNGETITGRFTAMGRQRSSLDFLFRPLEFQVPQLTSAQPSYDLFTVVQGTIRGRLLPNGRIELLIDTTRHDGLGARGGGPNGGGNGGRKQLEGGADEAVEIELPAPGGYSSSPTSRQGATLSRPVAPPSMPQQPVTLADGRLVVNNAMFFQGQHTSLIVQVNLVRP